MIPADICLDVGITSIGLIDIIVESTTPPVEGILFFFEMSNPLFYFFFLLIYSETEEDFLIYMKEGEEKKGNGYRTDKYSMSLDSLIFKTTNVALELIKYF